ncbi:peptide deformylase [Arthrobacter crusticola]|uniref:Peptide deformylase n=1 Tax=Arthrobacter crusticola TaxID=2547960 RepID=A0A4R5U2N1_9MICC|nr:peptide deformylase [Arthrobacter crusticola]TDK27838.1 peptide deformylase [Arthrobacter crusticola]
MAVLSIRIIGDPILRTPAATVTNFGPELEKLVADMTETMLDVQGVGLAAPQIGVGLSVFTYSIDGFEGHVVNPVLEVGETLQQDGAVEGCLSVPGLGNFLERAEWARVRGQDAHGEPVEVEGTGMLARCLQHETDHLRGTLYIDRLRGEEKKVAMRAIRSADYNSVAGQTAAQRAKTLGSSFISASAAGPAGAPRRAENSGRRR